MVDENLYKDMVFEDNRKSKTVAYLLWLFTGWFGVHRLYSGKTRSGVAQLLLTLTGVGFVIVFFWWLIDVFFVGDMVNERNLKTLAMINASDTRQPHGNGRGHGNGQGRLPDETRTRVPELDPKREAMLEDLRQTGYRKERRRDFSQLYR